MGSTTQNSGALAELRPAVIPSPDADFFSAFVPELVFALVVGCLAALAYYHFARLVSKLEPSAEKSEEKAFKGHKQKALESIESLNVSDIRFAEKIWALVRAYLVAELGNPMFPNMTAAEAVKATSSMEGFEPFAYFVRELEYSKDKSHERNARLKESATSFIRSR